MTENSDDLISRFVLLKDAGQHSIEIGLLMGSDRKEVVAIEPLLSSLQTLPTTEINFQIENNTLTMSANKHSVVFEFEISF